MKKLLLTLACAASLGLWMSCSDSNELDVTTHKGVDTVHYEYAGTVTATRYVYKPVELGTTKPASGKYYFIDEEWDEDKYEYVPANKYFHNAWVADKTPVTDNVATMEWGTDTTGATQTNIVSYYFDFRDNDISNSVETTIRKTGDTYSTSRGIVITLTAGTLDGATFTIKELPYDASRYGTLPDEDDGYYYESYNRNPQNYSTRYVSYGDIIYTRGK
ncbi:MAG: hypothetical protein K2N31_07640 [Treponemataceae bacterium]|nr:hypothetical protein [Treponemataceae bacterium]